MPCDCSGFPSDEAVLKATIIDILELIDCEKMREVLCSICKKLSKGQLLDTDGPYSGGLIEWYISHLVDDFNSNEDRNEKKTATEELKRLDVSLTYSKNLTNIIKYESRRITWRKSED